MHSDAAARPDAGHRRAGGRRRLAERQVPVRGHRSQDRPARSARGARSRAHRGPRASISPASAASSARLFGGAYVNRFNYFERSYKVIPQIGDADRATLEPLLDLKIKTPSGEMVPVSTFTRIETSVAPRTLNRFQQANAVRVFGGVQPGVTKAEGLDVLENAARKAGGGKDVTHRLRRRVAPDPRGRRGAHRHARLRADPHLPGARRAVPELPRSVDRVARLGAAGHLRRAGVHVPRLDHDQHLLAGGLDHARGPDREERHPHRGVREQAAGHGPGACSRRCAKLRSRDCGRCS